MKQIGIFADISNLYYCTSKKYKRKIDYRKFYNFIADLGDIRYAIGYGAQMEDEARAFILALRGIGFEPKYRTPKQYDNDGQFRRKADWDVGIAIDIVERINDLDIIVLGSADGDMVPVVRYSKDRGKDVIILACRISRDLKRVATESIEIPESLLETPRPKGAKTHVEVIEEKLAQGETVLGKESHKRSLEDTN